MEWAILYALRKHSPDGVARARWRWRTSGSAYYSSIDPERMKDWVGLVGWPYSGWFTHISGHPSATGQAWDRESSTLCRFRCGVDIRIRPFASDFEVQYQVVPPHATSWLPYRATGRRAQLRYRRNVFIAHYARLIILLSAAGLYEIVGREGASRTPRRGTITTNLGRW